MIATITRLTAMGLAVLVFSAGFAPEAAAGCDPFPRIQLWKSLSHDTVRQQVKNTYDGDWRAYIARLERYEGKLRGIRARGAAAVVTWNSKKIRLKGDAIEIFLGQVDRRLKVTRCLAENLAENDDIANFSTAAGGTDAATEQSRPIAASSRQCRAFPNVAWWKFKTHESVTGYVFRKYRGNWGAYIGTWSRRLAKLQNIYGRGSSAVTNTGELLKGSRLAEYIDKMQTRISVTRCLANRMGVADT